MSAISPIESRVTPVGIRFWDDLDRCFVGGGLEVSAQPAEVVLSPTVLVPSRSGVYYATNLPFFPAGGVGAGDDAYWASLTTRPFVVRVHDRERRFVPFSFTAVLPARGLVGWTCLAGPSPLPGNAPPSSVPLFSSPARRPGGGFAIVRASLWDAKVNAPAAFAALGLTLDPALPPVWSIADAEGRIALIFAYPELPPPPVDGTGLVPLSQQTWTLPIQVVYGPGGVGSSSSSSASSSLGASSSSSGGGGFGPFPETAGSGGPDHPDLCATFGQAKATLWSDQAMTTPMTSVTLTYGVELVMRTAASAAQAPPLSVVLVTGP